ncbi:cellulose-binding protein [Streptomyces sp. NPDC002004]
MSSASASPHGFRAVRGRGYRPERVDPYVSALARDRDEAWERATRLTAQARRMAGEAERLRETATRLAPQTYEVLGERARQVLALAEEEATALWVAARDEAQRTDEEAAAAGRALRDAAREYADELRAEAGEWARRRVLSEQAVADGIRAGAQHDAEDWRGEAQAALGDMGRRTAAMLHDQEKERAERWTAEERAIAGRAAELDAVCAQRVAAAEEGLSAAKQAFAQVEEEARHEQSEADELGAELVAEARMRAERIGRETERVLREHGDRWDVVRAQMDHVRASLAALTGRLPADDGPPEPRSPADDAP